MGKCYRWIKMQHYSTVTILIHVNLCTPHMQNKLNHEDVF
jgi:hypothetical protein